MDTTTAVDGALLHDGIMVRAVSRVYCGRTIAAAEAHDERNQEVRDASVERFVNEVVQKWFPEGHTMYHAQGGWQAKDGTLIREKSVVFEFIHEDENEDRTMQVAREWKRWFGQDSVMVSVQPTLMLLV